ncbi:MAG: DUF1987 domain-containing protein [Bacteroidales bacterium]|nr:DUF1987 domain-containing protein [Bacteroidales bacterium]
MASAIKETRVTPSVIVLRDERRIVISGSSRLEDPSKFYEEFDRLLNNSINEFKSYAYIDFHINYINSSSSKWLLHILKGLQVKYQGLKIVTINWFYDSDDDSMLEAGEVFQELINLPFNIIENIHR